MPRSSRSETTPWLWAAGGCCGGCLLLILVVGGIFGVGAFGIFGALGNSDAGKLAVERAEADPRVVEALGTPLETGWMTQGSISLDGQSGRADLTLPVTGPKGSGRLHVLAQRWAGEWELERVTLEVEGSSERIEIVGGSDLDLPAAPEPEATEPTVSL